MSGMNKFLVAGAHFSNSFIWVEEAGLSGTVIITSYAGFSASVFVLFLNQDVSTCAHAKSIEGLECLVFRFLTKKVIFWQHSFMNCLRGERKRDGGTTHRLF